MGKAPLAVVTFLWSDPYYRWNDLFEYGVDHVNRLASAVRRNLNRPHDFICVTDSKATFDTGVNVVPIWDDLAQLGGCFRRLKAFAPEMRDVLGERFIWLDLDTVVVGGLDPLFNRREDFVAWRDVNPPTPYCGSMVMMDAGARRRVWDDFDAARSPLKIKKSPYIGTDQAWIGMSLGPDEAVWTEDDGVLSFARQAQDGLPTNARVVFFHGKHDPSLKPLQDAHPWIKECWK